jgi:N-methylhydantoinase A
MVDMVTIGAGGGSIAKVADGTLTVGPQSAGADPGPAAYGRGGTEATVTDAHVVLGHLPARLLGGRMALDVAAAARAIDSNVARPLGLGREEAARGMLAILDNNMMGALRIVSVERGHDPRDFALVAFGGAGPLHACELADELGIRKVLVSAAAGVLSALGLVASEERRDRVRSYVIPLEEAGLLPQTGEVDLRYKGQSFELTVSLEANPAEAFHRAHEERYGYADRERPIELVAVRSAEVTPGPELTLPAGEPESRVGPAVVELDGATCWIPPGWEGARDGNSTWILTRS